MSQPKPFRRGEITLANIAGHRVGIELNWFIQVIRSFLKREDGYWMLGGPITPAMIRLVEKFLERLASQNITPVFVADGLYTCRQAHPAVLLHKLDDTVRDLPQHVRDAEPMTEDAISFILRTLIGMNVEVITAPYLATAQLAYLAKKPDGTKGYNIAPYIDDVFGTLDILCYGTVMNVVLELNALLTDPNATLTTFGVPQYDQNLVSYIVDPSRVAKSVHWCWAAEIDPMSDVLTVRTTMENCPVLTVEGKLDPFAKVVYGDKAPALMSDYYYMDVGQQYPLLYFLLSSNVISSQLLNVVVTGKFIDDPPLFKSVQYESTLERIIPLRTQIVFQLIQDLQRYLLGLQRTSQLIWDRPHTGQRLPIQRPPKIVLDEWQELDEDPKYPYTFTSVLEFAQKAVAPPEENAAATPAVVYKSAEQARGAVLLKSLDLLGYFTHAAHTGTDAEESSMSIFAMALNKAPRFGAEAVLLIELTRTRSLHDFPLEVLVHREQLPPPSVQSGVRYACRIMSLLQLKTSKAYDAAVTPYSTDLLAFNEVARSFQRNLRLLTEAITVTQFLSHTATYPLQDVRNFAYTLPFGVPLTVHAGIVLETMMLTPEYQMLPKMADTRYKWLQAKFPHVDDMKAQLKDMLEFWKDCVAVIQQLLEDDEAEPEFQMQGKTTLKDAHNAVTVAFTGISQVPAISV
jgi:hypothetical protein